jgi:hypothetical protein
VALHDKFLMPEKSAETAANVAGMVGRFLVVAIDCDAGHVMLGAVVSVTLTVKVHVDVRFALSVAVQPTTVVPKVKLAPDVALHDELLIPDPSVTENPVVLKMMGMAGNRLAVALVMFGQVHRGGVTSLTLTGNVHETTWPAVSTAEHVVLVEPRLKDELETGAQVSDVTVRVDVALGCRTTFIRGTPMEAVISTMEGQVNAATHQSWIFTSMQRALKHG